MGAKAFESMTISSDMLSTLDSNRNRLRISNGNSFFFSISTTRTVRSTLRSSSSRDEDVCVRLTIAFFLFAVLQFCLLDVFA